jgi:pimeloyl-ACP methyl ester carboxylesterase
MRSSPWQKALLVLAVGCGIAIPQGLQKAALTLPADPQVLTFFSSVDDSDQPYALFLPKQYDSSKAYPLVVSLHDEGSNHRLNLRRVFGHSGRTGDSDADFIVISPLARGTMGYQGIAERDVYDVLADVRSRFRIDEDRIYLTGSAMGGGGALWLGLSRPDIWAAIAPVCPSPPAEAAALAGNGLNVPIKLFQGRMDPVVKAESVREWHKLLTDSSVNAEYVEYPAIRHNAWDQAYKNGAILTWFARHRRVPYPQRVQFASRDYAHDSAYWVRFDSLTPGTVARIDARFESQNVLVIGTKNSAGVTLLLKGHPSFRAKQRLSITIDGDRLRALRAGGEVSLAKTAEGWAIRRALPDGGDKRQGAEGPVSDALSSRHIYVYGTADSPAAEEVIRRRAVAEQAADWSTRQSRLLLAFRILADAEVKESDLQQANLVLFGTRETNSVIARFSSQLPMALNPGAADYSLTYIYPVGSRYFLINSGLPWWTRADQVQRMSLPFGNVAYRTAQSFGDFMLFRGGLDNVITEGRFDNKWNLPEEAVKRIAATRAVEIIPVAREVKSPKPGKPKRKKR